ncbi:DUF6121 family protein [Compostimonas suwonensis]|uniref:DUF6121 family protein n=1 Tax=Compostimonas suwonensis TaxID=1048394 RepID=UPI000C2456C0|nr:DUF6121 family protein [Compostimonas suwonensis]
MAAFSAMGYGALLVAAFGILSLLTDRDVIDDPDAGPLVGPVMTVAAILFVLLVLVRVGRATPLARQRPRLWLSLGVGLGAYLVFALVGALAFSIGTGAVLGFLGFAFSQLISPFAVAAGVAAIVVTLLFSLILASRGGGSERPEWPWEHNEQ